MLIAFPKQLLLTVTLSLLHYIDGIFPSTARYAQGNNLFSIIWSTSFETADTKYIKAVLSGLLTEPRASGACNIQHECQVLTYTNRTSLRQFFNTGVAFILFSFCFKTFYSLSLLYFNSCSNIPLEVAEKLQVLSGFKNILLMFFCPCMSRDRKFFYH